MTVKVLLGTEGSGGIRFVFVLTNCSTVAAAISELKAFQRSHSAALTFIISQLKLLYWHDHSKIQCCQSTVFKWQ